MALDTTEIIAWPLLLAGSGLGMMASQLGAVTVSSVPDEKSGEVGGLQNTGTQLGASIGTALAGAVLISAMTASFFTGIENNPNVPDSVVSQAQTQLAAGVPFISEADAEAALQKSNVPPATADEIVKQNEKSQIDGLRAAEAILALLALVAIPFTRGIPASNPAAKSSPYQRPHSWRSRLSNRHAAALGLLAAGSPRHESRSETAAHGTRAATEASLGSDAGRQTKARLGSSAFRSRLEAPTERSGWGQP
jgi:hypothetical protein